MPPKKRPSKASGKRKRQQDSPEEEDQTQAQNAGNVRGTIRSVDGATTDRLRRAYPFLTHTRQAFVEGTPAHQAAASQSSFPTQDEIAKWKSKGGIPANYPTRLGNLAEWLREIAALGPPPRPNTQRARAIAKARAELAEAEAEAEAEQSDADSEMTDSADETTSQSDPRALPSKAKRRSRENSSTSDANAEEEEAELTPSIGNEARQLRPRGSASGARKTVKGESPSPVVEEKAVKSKSKSTPTKWITLPLGPPKRRMPRIPGLKYEVENEIASELTETVEEDPAYDSEETTDDPDLIEMKDATSILMSMAADEEAGRQIEEANRVMSIPADQEAARQIGATREYETAEPLLVLSKSSGNSHGAVDGVEHRNGETDEEQGPDVQFAPAPVRVTFNLAHAPSRITNRPPKKQNESLLGPPGIDERGRAVKSKKRKHEEIEET